jgi:DNA-binding NarL/FixJ family response regulator
LSFSKAVAHLVGRGCRVLAISGWASSDIVLEVVAQGARGYLPKDGQVERFAEAIEDIARVGYHISPHLALYLRNDLGCRPLEPDLDWAEHELLNACADGDSRDEIAVRTGVPVAGLHDLFARVFEAARRRRHDPRYRPTPREEEVMILAGYAGMNDRRIAQQLGGISLETVTSHLAHIKEKYRRTHPDDAESTSMSPRATAGRWVRDLGLCE